MSQRWAGRCRSRFSVVKSALILLVKAGKEGEWDREEGVTYSLSLEALHEHAVEQGNESLDGFEGRLGSLRVTSSSAFIPLANAFSTRNASEKAVDKGGAPLGYRTIS